MVEPRASDVAAMRDAITAAGKVRLSNDDVWSLWCRAVPRLAGAAEQRQVLTRALELLADTQVIELPTSPQSRMTATRLPRHVTVPAARRGARAQPWKSYPWLRRLGWISSLGQVADDVFDDLVAINDWLVQVGERTIPIVPVRYRSAEIFDRRSAWTSWPEPASSVRTGSDSTSCRAEGSLRPWPPPSWEPVPTSSSSRIATPTGLFSKRCVTSVATISASWRGGADGRSRRRWSRLG